MKIQLPNIKHVIAAVVLMGGINVANAYDFETGGIYYDKLSDTEVAVTFKGESATSQMEYVGDVVIPSTVDIEGVSYNVTAIKNGAFQKCTITSVKIPEGVKSIGTSAFQGCTELDEIEIPEGVTSIKNGLCNGCTGLMSVIIPASVESIGDLAFQNCISLEMIKVLRTTPPTVNSRSFLGVNSSAVLEVPSESVVLYQSTDVWKDFSEIKGIVQSENDEATKINSVKAENCEVVEYYNILGVKVENPTKGLYIKRCGNKAYKVML